MLLFGRLCVLIAATSGSLVYLWYIVTRSDERANSVDEHVTLPRIGTLEVVSNFAILPGDIASASIHISRSSVN